MNMRKCPFLRKEYEAAAKRQRGSGASGRKK
jgi:hypothetical protein